MSGLVARKIREKFLNTTRQVKVCYSDVSYSDPHCIFNKTLHISVLKHVIIKQKIIGVFLSTGTMPFPAAWAHSDDSSYSAEPFFGANPYQVFFHIKP